MTAVRTQLWIPSLPPVFNNVNGVQTITRTIDASGEKFAWIGRVHWPDSASSKNIRKVHIFPSAITDGTGTLAISLQDVLATTGAPPRPDETQDEKALAWDITSLTAGAWNVSPQLDADRTVNKGDLIAAVLEFDTFVADAVTLSNGQVPSAVSMSHEAVCVCKESGSWNSNFGAGAFGHPSIIFEMSDGSYGTFAGCLPIASASGANINTGTTPDEYGMRFELPFDCKIDGVYVICNPSGAARNFSIIVSNAGGALVTVQVDTEQIVSNASGLKPYYLTFPDVSLTKNTAYYVSMRPETANNNQISRFHMFQAPYLATMYGGTTWFEVNRTNGGAWDESATASRTAIGIRVCEIDDGAGAGGGGGGLLVNPGMRGGMI